MQLFNLPSRHLKAINVTTPVVAELLSLAAVKQHLRLDSVNYADDYTPVQSIPPGSHGVNVGLNGTGLDILGYQALVILESGTNGTSGTVDVKIQESDDNINFTNWVGGVFAQVTTATDNATYKIAYTGNKRYLRVVAVIGLMACEFAVSIAKIAPYSPEDSLISSLITTAREYCEDYTHRAIGVQKYEMVLDNFPQDGRDFIEIPISPLVTVDTFTFKNSLGATATTDSNIYDTDIKFEPGKIYLKYNRYWPMFIPYPYAAVTIGFTAGHTLTNVPVRIMQAMLLLIAHWYEHREEVVTDRRIEQLPMGVDALLRPLKVY